MGSNDQHMKYSWILFALLFLLLAPLMARADGNEVVVIYNKPACPESKSVAEYYARARQVPPKQIYGFSMTTNEVMSRDEFRDTLQLPLARRLESDGLWQFGPTTYTATNGEPPRVDHQVIASKIRYVVLCYGVPLKIAPDPNLNEPIQCEMRAGAAPQRSLRGFRTCMAAVGGNERPT